MQTLPRRLSRCILQEEPFEPGNEYISLLDLEGRRKDFCPACWEKVEKPLEGHFWRGKIPLKSEKILTRDEQALALFRQVEDPKQRFILALYLQRKNQLVQRTQALYELPETGEIFDIKKVALSKEEGEAIAEQLTHLLDSGAMS